MKRRYGILEVLDSILSLLVPVGVFFRSRTDTAIEVLALRLSLPQTSNWMRTWDLRILHQLLRSTLNTLRVLAAALSGTFKSRARVVKESGSRVEL